jgi:hypothetical protein
VKVVKIAKDYEEIEPKFPVLVTCQYCESRIELDEKDVSIGEFGVFWYRCPVCKRRDMVDELPGITLSKNTIEFPTHFHHFVDGVDIQPEDIKKWIGEAIDFFRENPDSFTYITGSGNTGVMVQNYSGDEDYYVVVTKDFYDINIPYEDEDYAAQDKNSWEWKNKGVNLKRNDKD